MLVSVIIPAFNAADWISETLRSVLTQTYNDVEVILVDDGSTDRTAELADRTLRHGGRPYRILSQTNGGVSSARNRGWKAARGSWVQFLDADDLLDPSKIELQIKQSQAGSAWVIYSDWQKLTWQRNMWKAEEKIRNPVIGAEPLADILADANFMQLGSQLIRMDALRATNGFDEAHCLVEDVELSLKIAMADGKFIRAPSIEPVSWYRDRPESLSKSDQSQFVEACLRNAQLVDRYIKKQKVKSAPVIDAVVEVYFSGARYFAGRDWNRFEQIVAGIEELRPAFVPRAPARLKVLSCVAGYRNAERLAILYSKSKRFRSAFWGAGDRERV
jgi:glycosyltransferase involved in cell wall biosynthesis